MTPVISLKNVTKRFPGVLANDSISLEIFHEVHAIVGENGAGKSTLMKILCGLLKPDSGEIWRASDKVVFQGTRQAIQMGIGMVHQHFMLIGCFSVLENIILGAEPSQSGVLDMPAARQRVTALMEQYGFDLDLDARLSDLSVGQQQRVEILKVLYRGADVLILDEPTAVLAPQEVTDLFRNLRLLVTAGKTIIFISHKLDEVLAIADRISVLRRGRMVGTLSKSTATRETIAQMMVGREVLWNTEMPQAHLSEPLLLVSGLTVKGSQGAIACSDISFSVRGGEILGIAGVEGNGQSEMVLAIAGLLRSLSGSVRIGERDVTNESPRRLREAGLAHIPEDRQKRGLVLPMSLLDNFILGSHWSKRYRKGLLMNTKYIAEEAMKAVRQFDIRVGSLDSPAATLSGGNQQKIILSRELGANPRVIIASQPMRGLDIGASEFVRSVLLEARSSGCAVLLLSADLEDLLALSDRIAVMYRGHIVASLAREEATISVIGKYMLGPMQEVANEAD